MKSNFVKGLGVSITLVILTLIVIGEKTSDNDIFIPLNRKELLKLESGNLLDKISGIKTTFNGIKCRIKYENKRFIVTSNEIIYDGFRNIVLLHNKKAKSIKIHKRQEHLFKQESVSFSNYDGGKYLILPIFNQENIEILKERFEKFEDLVNDSMIYKNTLQNIVLTNINGEDLIFEKSIFLKDPLTGKFSVLPDLFSPLKKVYGFNTEQVKHNDIIEGEVLIDSSYSETKHFKNTNLTNHIKKLTLKKNTSLIFTNCIVNLNDLEIISQGRNSIIFYDCEIVNLDKIRLVSISNFESSNVKLPSGLTFSNCNVEIKNSLFENNLIGDDFINFYHSKFIVQKSTFRNIVSDAIDSDFSSGEILNSKFVFIGNDAIDTSGSNLKIENCYFNNVEDKSLSVGESSNVISKQNIFETNSLALVVKDGSILDSKNDIFKNNDLDVSVFQKKNFYTNPKLKIDQFLNDHIYLIENNSIIESIDTLKLEREKNIKNVMYGKKFGRKTLK